MKIYAKRLLAIASVLLILFVTGCGNVKKNSEVSDNLVKNMESSTNSRITIGELEESIGTDVVLLMDESGSMVKADENRIAIEGAKLFIDMQKLTNANIALIEFSNKVIASDMLEMTQQNKENLKDILDSVNYEGTAHTDIGAGLLKSVDMLNNAGDNRNKSIILFTDGRTDIDVGTPGRSTKDSENDVRAAVQEAQERGYKIYCIGLNDNGSVDEQELRTITETTGGQYLIASNVDDITMFFEKIFGAIGDSDVEKLKEFEADGSYQDVQFSIEDENIIEANIVILSSKSIEDVILARVDEDPVDLGNSDKFVFTRSNRYTLVKMILPIKGDWVIRVKGVSGDLIHVSKICNYEISLMVDVSKTKVKRGETVDVRAYLSSSGKVIADAEYYSSLAGYLHVVNTATGSEIQSEMDPDKDGNGLFGAFAPEDRAVYEVRIHIQGNGFYRDSTSFYVEVYKDPLVVSPDTIELRLTTGQREEIDLNQYFTDENGDKISYILSELPKEVDAAITENILKITALEEGTVKLQVFGDNGSAEKVSLMLVLICEEKEFHIFIVIIPIVLILAVLCIILILRKMSQKLQGKFKFSLESCMMDEYGTPSITEFDILTDINADQVGKHEFSVKKLLSFLSSYYLTTEFIDKKKTQFTQCINKISLDADKVKVCGTNREFTLKVKKKSKRVQFVESGVVRDKQALEVSLAGGFTNVVPVAERTFGIRFQTEKSKEYIQINIIYKKM
jgi:Mg-chelatase subunit ChlD